MKIHCACPPFGSVCVVVCVCVCVFFFSLCVRERMRKREEEEWERKEEGTPKTLVWRAKGKSSLVEEGNVKWSARGLGSPK